jgi:hypothetical protein
VQALGVQMLHENSLSHISPPSSCGQLRHLGPRRALALASRPDLSS